MTDEIILTLPAPLVELVYEIVEFAQRVVESLLFISMVTTEALGELFSHYTTN